jgi:hypothetical protein
MGELARRARLSKQTMTELIRRFERRGTGPSASRSPARVFGLRRGGGLRSISDTSWAQPPRWAPKSGANGRASKTTDTDAILPSRTRYHSQVRELGTGAVLRS